jgi:predicted secreted protein
MSWFVGSRYALPKYCHKPESALKSSEYDPMDWFGSFRTGGAGGDVADAGVGSGIKVGAGVTVAIGVGVPVGIDSGVPKLTEKLPIMCQLSPVPPVAPLNPKPL